jgi:hypothetical protein
VVLGFPYHPPFFHPVYKENARAGNAKKGVIRDKGLRLNGHHRRDTAPAAWITISYFLNFPTYQLLSFIRFDG